MNAAAKPPVAPCPRTGRYYVLVNEFYCTDYEDENDEQADERFTRYGCWQEDGKPRGLILFNDIAQAEISLEQMVDYVDSQSEPLIGGRDVISEGWEVEEHDWDGVLGIATTVKNTWGVYLRRGLTRVGGGEYGGHPTYEWFDCEQDILQKAAELTRNVKKAK